MAEDFAKEPPPPPAHLQLTLLNVPPAMDAAASLPRPQHVILNHVYCQRATHQARAPTARACYVWRACPRLAELLCSCPRRLIA